MPTARRRNRWRSAERLSACRTSHSSLREEAPKPIQTKDWGHWLPCRRTLQISHPFGGDNPLVLALRLNKPLRFQSLINRESRCLLPAQASILARFEVRFREVALEL